MGVEQKAWDSMSLEERQLDLASAVVAAILFGHVERIGTQWSISARMPASAHAAVIVEGGSGPEEVVEVRGATFSDALTHAIKRGMGDASELEEKSSGLLTAWGMDRF